MSILGSYMAGLAMGRKHRAIEGEVDFNRSGLCPYFIDGYNDGYLRGK